MAKWCDIFLRGLFLFSLGVFLFLVSDALQSIRGGVVDSDPSLWGPLSPKLWIPLGCGFASALIGLLSPFIDFKLGISDVYNNEWSTVLRCVALFFGLNHATVRIDFASYMQLAITIFGLSFGLWWHFDRSRVGLGCGMTVALIATILGQSFVRRRLVRFSHPIMAAWVPCLSFCGGVTMVLVGRQLAKPDVLARSKRKID